MSTNSTLTARDIIYQAMTMLGIYSFGEIMSQEDAVNGLRILNEILGTYSGNGSIVPYNEKITFNLKSGQQNYTFGKTGPTDVNSRKISQLVYVNYFIDDASYPVRILSKNNFYQNYKVDDLKSLPCGCFLQNTTYNSVITFYPVPAENYKCTIVAKFAFDDVELDDRIDEIPPFMRGFLRYSLARELSDMYAVQWTPKQEQQYARLLALMHINSDNDYTYSDYDAINFNSYESVKGGYGF